MTKRRPIGAVLAGGRATRLGGDKACAQLAGRPLLARYEAAALPALRAAAPDAPLTAVVEALGPRVVELPDEGPFLNVNTPADVAAAAQFLSRDS